MALRQGPPQIWQDTIYDDVSYISPRRRLHRAGRWGLPVGRGTRWLGGLRTNTARDWEDLGIVTLVRDDTGLIIHVYPCQLSFNF